MQQQNTTTEIRTSDSGQVFRKCGELNMLTSAEPIPPITRDSKVTEQHMKKL